jgi:hypothetical protein
MISVALIETNEYTTHLLPNQGLLNCRQILQRRQEHVRMFRSPDILCEVAQLLAEGSQDLIFIFNGI